MINDGFHTCLLDTNHTYLPVTIGYEFSVSTGKLYSKKSYRATLFCLKLRAGPDVNGRFAGTTIDNEQRQMVVPIPTSLESPVHIEVVGVKAEQANMDFSSEMAQPPADSGRVRIVLLRSQSLPAGATAQIYFDNGTGQIDYDIPLTDSPLRIWPTWQDKAGFAMAGFGLGDLGYDSAAAVGFGRGSFGNGQFGLDADTIEWISPHLQSGVYKFSVKITDESGNQSCAVETEPITVTPAARPADELRVSSFDKQTNQLLLEII